MTTQQIAKAPLRKIIARPEQMAETLECGHTLPRPAGLGEDLMKPSKVKSRRCWMCQQSA
jgi:hypothetical protein